MRHNAKFSTSRLIVGGISFVGHLMRVHSKETRTHSSQHDAVSIPTSNPDVLVNNVGTLYTFCPLTLRAKEWIEEHVRKKPSGSGPHSLSNIVMRGDWLRG